MFNACNCVNMYGSCVNTIAAVATATAVAVATILVAMEILAKPRKYGIWNVFRIIIDFSFS